MYLSLIPNLPRFQKVSSESGKMPKKAPKMTEEERLQWEADKAAAEADAEVRTNCILL
jgi:hypothetical protein